MNHVVFSIDAELAWGYHDLCPLSTTDLRRINSARSAWKRLIGLFDEFEIPATWAVVAHLLDDNLDAEDDNHPLSPNWFRTYRKRRAQEPELWFGRDLIDRVINADVNHDLGCHSYSHVIFDDVPEEVASTELRLSQAVAQRYGEPFESFIFPRNAVGHRDLLDRHGFTSYRGTTPQYWPRIPGSGFARLIAGYTVGMATPPIVTPSLDRNGLVNVPASMHLAGFNDTPWSTVRPLRGDPAVRLARLGMERVLEVGGIFHLWLHPNDLWTRDAINSVRSILSIAREFSDRRGLSVATMDQIAQRVQNTA